MGETAAPDVPDIEPSSFDLVVIGTGFQESLLAGAAAQAGKTVLHLDPASSYGAHWASHRLDTFLDWAAMQQQWQEPSIRDSSSNGGDQRRSSQRSDHESSAASAPQAAAADEIPVPAAGAGVYSHVSMWRGADADLGAARDYNIDLAAKAVLCAGPLVKALLASGAHNYVEFRALSSSWLWRGGRLTPVPATRADVFAAEGLTLPQRRALMRFLTAAQAAMQGGGPLQDAFDGRPFAQLLAEQGLQPGVRALLLYAVAMLEADQEPGPASPTPMPLAALPPAARDAAAAANATAIAGAPAAGSLPQPPDGAGGAPGGSSAPDAAAHAAAAAAANPAFGGGVATAAQGLEALRLYMQSAGKYGPGTGAFLLPCYGAGELPQAFCRVAAVAGAMYVLRRPVSAILLHPGTGAVRGIRLADGQQLSCHALAGDVSAFAGLQEAQEAEHARRYGGGNGSADGPAGAAAAQAADAPDGGGAAVARAVAITDVAPLQQGSGGGGGGGSALVIFPPRSLPSGNAAAVRVLQVGSSTAAAPQGRFLLHAATAAGAGAGPVGRDVAGGAAAGCLPPPPGLQDVQEALAALVSLPTAQQQQQQPQQQQSQQPEGLPPLPGPAVGNSAKADSRPRVLLLASWVQSAAAVPEGLLPPNAVCSAPPDGGLDFRAALAAATAAFAKLFPEAAAARGGQLFGGSQASGGTGGGGGGDLDAAADFDGHGAADDDSDEDTLASLQAALAGIGGHAGKLANGVPGTGHD